MTFSILVGLYHCMTFPFSFIPSIVELNYSLIYGCTLCCFVIYSLEVCMRIQVVMSDAVHFSGAVEICGERAQINFQPHPFERHVQSEIIRLVTRLGIWLALVPRPRPAFRRY